MSEHPTAAELKELVHGGLSELRSREIARHLVRCRDCRSAVASFAVDWPLRNLIPPDAPQVESSAYDAVINRAILFARRERGKVRREKARADEAVAILREKGVAGFPEARRHLRGVSACQALMEHCQALRYDDPRQMVAVAELAVHLAENLGADRHGARQVADLRCHALAELGNAYRVADRLDEASRTLDEADAAFLQGSGDELLQARLFDVRASVHADRRRFEEACKALDTVYAIHWKLRDRHSAGRALISKGIYTGYDNRPEDAIRFLRLGLRLIDREKDPDLVFMGMHAQVHFLVDSGRAQEARALLWRRPLPSDAVGGRLTLLKMRWLEAKVDAALGTSERAEQSFLEVKEGFAEAGLPYKAALAGLELVTFWMKQGRTAQAQSLVIGLVEMFQALEIHREALAALLLLHIALAEGVRAQAILKDVTEFLKQAEGDPTLTFRSWFLPA
ncbi:MAG TPA: hypothetical protein VF756_22045 [Thermoanaerobaculia bacterium]